MKVYCNICHSTDYITMQPPFKRSKWEDIVEKMRKTFGCPVKKEDARQIVDYIVRNYGESQ